MDVCMFVLDEGKGGGLTECETAQQGHCLHTGIPDSAAQVGVLTFRLHIGHISGACSQGWCYTPQVEQRMRLHPRFPCQAAVRLAQNYQHDAMVMLFGIV